VIRVQLAGRPGPALDAIRTRLGSAAIEVVGISPRLDEALSADVDVVLAVDGQVAPARLADGDGPALLVAGGSDAIARLARAGHPAWGLVPPDAAAAELEAAVTAVAHGLIVLPTTAFPVDAARHSEPAVEGDDLDPYAVEALTPREREVLELASRGLSNRDVAATLGISEHTVKFHLASVYGKLGAASRADAVRRGLRRGLITI
jgi:DNA-binding NarL/FixJ family response regulator